MAKPKTVSFKYTAKKPKGVKRIKIPQSPKRPVQIRGAGVRKAELKAPKKEFVLHRKGVAGRPQLEEDPYEKYAVPSWQVKGYQGERIVYKMALTHHQVPGSDFTFQSSMDGGRMEMGGIVVDFMWPKQKLIVQLQGPTHKTNIREAKDAEQASILESMGYTVLYLDYNIVHDIGRLDEWFRRYIDKLTPIGGSYNLGLASPEEGTEVSLALAGQIIDSLRRIDGYA
jgi:very-short-patch-repair endonuclease